MNKTELLARQQFHFTPKQTYNEKDYVPLPERDDWNGRVIRLDNNNKPILDPDKPIKGFTKG